VSDSASDGEFEQQDQQDADGMGDDGQEEIQHDIVPIDPQLTAQPATPGYVSRDDIISLRDRILTMLWLFHSEPLESDSLRLNTRLASRPDDNPGSRFLTNLAHLSNSRPCCLLL
jgi:hypothetical protein